MTAMRISNYEFGKIVIADKTYTSDVIVAPEQVIDSWCRKEGHNLRIEDLDDIVNAKPDMLIIGTGYYGRMQVPLETTERGRARTSYSNSIMFCCKRAVALHTPEANWRAELLTKLVKMPLMQYYRQLLSKAEA